MPDSANAIIVESALADGTPVCMRTIRKSDEERIREGIGELSDRSRYLRFFSAFKMPPPAIVSRLSDADGHDHIGWGALRTDLPDCPAIGAAHAVRLQHEDVRGELAVAILDDYHGLGLARMLIAAVLHDCETEGLNMLEVHMLPENNAATKLIRGLGATRRHAIDSVAHYDLDVSAALLVLRRPDQPAGVRDVIATLMPAHGQTRPGVTRD